MVGNFVVSGVDDFDAVFFERVAEAAAGVVERKAVDGDSIDVLAAGFKMVVNELGAEFAESNRKIGRGHLAG